MRKVALLTIALILTALLAGCAGGEEVDFEVDKIPPVISAVSVSNITQTSATITWTTNEPSTSQAEYGTTLSYGTTTALDDDLVINHSVSITGLTIGTTYHCRVKSRDASGNERTYFDKTFATLGLPDTTAPVISNVSVSNITETTAIVTWSTNEPATSQVQYGTTLAYGVFSPWNTGLITSHSVSLSGLTAGMAYHYMVKSKDAAENEANSSDYTFVTLGAVPADFVTYTDEAGFFSISYPNDWQSIELPGIIDTTTIAQEIREGDLEGAITVFMAGLSPINTPSVSINVNTTQGMGDNLYDEIQLAIEWKRTYLSDYQLVSLIEATIGGRYAVIEECVADYTGNGSVHYVHLGTVYNQTLWAVTCGSSISQFDDYEAELYQIVYSFYLFD